MNDKLDVRKIVLAFLEKYSFWVHAFLAAWNSFVVSWATGINLPLSDYGIPITINARQAVSWVQAHTHIPTVAIAILTLAINATTYYINWKKSHVQVVNIPEGSVLVGVPASPSSTPAVEKTIIEVKDESGNSKTIN